MQNLPPQNSEPDKTPPSAPNEQEARASIEHSLTNLEPQYQEFPSPGGVANLAPAPPATQSISAPGASVAAFPPQSVQPPVQPTSQQPAPQPNPVPPLAQPTYIQPTPSGHLPQPGYVPITPQPGYIPMTPQPGYIPPTPQPGYPQPGRTGPIPGYPPQQAYPPGYLPPPVYTPQPPAKRNWLAITSVVLASLLLLAIILGGVVLDREGTPSATNTPATSTTPTAAIGQPTSAFETASCPFQVGEGITEGQQLTCGYVTVPEDHAKKNGPTIKLAVAIFKAPQYMNSVDPDPVLRLEGGPGGPSLDGWAHYVTSADYNQLIFDHDIIMFDQRGIGYSKPSLNCSELIALANDSSASANSTQTYEQAAHTCYNRLEGDNIDLNDFNTIQNAGDVASIIHALGYQQMTLYGVSYGTRLALTTMRLYPSVIHSVILDSVYPTDHNRNELTTDAQRVFTTLFQGCAKDAHCNGTYPNLQTVFYNLVDQLNAHPITFNAVDPTSGKSYSIQFAGDDMVSFLFSALYATPFIPALPEIIYQVKAGNDTLLAQMYAELNLGNPPDSDGLFYSTECSEDWPYLTQQDITASEQNVDPHIAKVFGQEDEEIEYDVCQFWKVNKLPAVQKQPVHSSLPTLVLTGEYDPITPPALGKEVAQGLSHSYFFTFPGQGHGQQYSSDCSNRIVTAFEDNPDQAPDSTCISQMTEPQFA